MAAYSVAKSGPPRPAPDLTAANGLSIAMYGLAAWALSASRQRTSEIGEVEFAFPSPWREVFVWSGNAVAFMSGSSALCCLYLAASGGGGLLWKAGALSAMLAVFGYLAARHGGRFELCRDGIRMGPRLYRWAALGKFEWEQPSVLRIQAGEENIRIDWHGDAAVEAILVRHGLVKW